MSVVGNNTHLTNCKYSLDNWIQNISNIAEMDNLLKITNALLIKLKKQYNLMNDN